MIEGYEGSERFIKLNEVELKDAREYGVTHVVSGMGKPPPEFEAMEEPRFGERITDWGYITAVQSVGDFPRQGVCSLTFG